MVFSDESNFEGNQGFLLKDFQMKNITQGFVCQGCRMVAVQLVFGDVLTTKEQGYAQFKPVDLSVYIPEYVGKHYITISQTFFQ